ncbi:MAG: antibiotic biosynthesis monooxygenase [Proteobacteria bacterium]|nr:antibiotic biosynthesis monooxygenase [Pseudomonadota bacterium]MBS0573704.1 antibiotic biosynthesis monooxygenase [Pseudomonadota bacterium]
MTQVILTGFLICRSLDESDRVAALLPDHIRATRAEPGCLVFEVLRSMADPVRFAVREVFACRADFDAHLQRIRQSPWARATRGIPRDYMLTDSAGQRRFILPGAEAE